MMPTCGSGRRVVAVQHVCGSGGGAHVGGSGMPTCVAVEGGVAVAARVWQWQHVGGAVQHVGGSGRRWWWCPRGWQWQAVVVVPTCVAMAGGVVLVPTCVAVTGGLAVVPTCVAVEGGGCGAHVCGSGCGAHVCGSGRRWW